MWTDISHLQQKDPERTGYATQKPKKLLERIIRPVTVNGDLVVDLCCGSGTTMDAASTIGCRFLGIDNNAGALEVTASRLRNNNYTVQDECTVDDAAVEAVFERERGVMTLMAFHAPGDFPQLADPLGIVEQWRAGRVKDGVFYADENLLRSHLSPDLPSWGLMPDGEGTPAISITDAAGKRRVFVWED